MAAPPLTVTEDPDPTTSGVILVEPARVLLENTSPGNLGKASPSSPTSYLGFTTAKDTQGGFVRVDVKTKHISATRRAPLMSVHNKDGFEIVNYCTVEKTEYLREEILEQTQLNKMDDEDCDDTQSDGFVMVSNVSML